MILLTSTSDKIQVVTDASANVHVHASWVDNAAGTVTPGRTDTAYIQTGTTTDVVAPPGASTQRNVRALSVRNAHASVSCNVTVQHTDGTSTETLMTAGLAIGETLLLTETGRWSHVDASGDEATPSSIFAAQSDMETATSTVLATSPGTMKYHPALAKTVLKCGVTGNIITGYNVSSIADTGAGQTTPSMITSYSSANWICLVACERSSTTVNATNLKYVNVRSATQAAGSVTLECYDGNTTTHNIEDPTSWHVYGLGDF